MKNIQTQKDKLVVGELYEFKDNVLFVKSDSHGNSIDPTNIIGFRLGERFVVVGKNIEKTCFVCYSITREHFFPFYPETPIYEKHFEQFIKPLTINQ